MGDILQLMTVSHAYCNFATVTPSIPQKWPREKKILGQRVCVALRVKNLRRGLHVILLTCSLADHQERWSCSKNSMTTK